MGILESYGIRRGDRLAYVDREPVDEDDLMLDILSIMHSRPLALGFTRVVPSDAMWKGWDDAPADDEEGDHTMGN